MLVAVVLGFSAPTIIRGEGGPKQVCANRCSWTYKRNLRSIPHIFSKHASNAVARPVAQGGELVEPSLIEEIPSPALQDIVTGTQLQNCSLGMLYNAKRDGWDNDVFFEVRPK